MTGIAIRRTVAVSSLILAAACGGKKEPDLSSFSGRSDRMVWDAGQKAIAKKDWLTAREYFRRIVDGFPNSEFAAQARVALGDTYLREGGTANYILAISEFRQFLTLFPSHSLSDYAQFQIAESFFKQKNGPDRDQSQTRDALAEYEKLVTQHPESQYTRKAQDRITECRYSLARAEHLVGVFYQRSRQAYRSAALRFESLIAQYPEYPQMDEILFRLSECLVASGRNAEAAPHLQRLVEKYPQSRFSTDARKMLARLAAATPSSTT
jgi:outer membrane protein assembly factor BamD